MKLRRIIAGLISICVVFSITACSNSSPAGTTANQSTNESTTKDADGNASIKLSWWGGDARHEATRKAIDKFMEKYPDIKVTTEYGAWSGWEDAMSTKFYAGTAPDVNQINWNWITSFNADGKTFLDINTVSDKIDLTQFDKAALESCTVDGKLQAIPVSLTGRIFYWNKTTFDKAGISTPKSLADLLAAGKKFKETLGEDYYPIALGEYDRMILMVYYLESVYGKNWVENNKLNYTKEEIMKGLEFIKSLEDNHVTPSIKGITGDGAESLDKNPKWMAGKYAGIFEWDSSASKFSKALSEGQKFVVGDFMPDMGKNQGGFTKVSLAFAISKNTKYPAECAKLINFLLNEEDGVKIMGSERGIPISKAGMKICKDNNLFDPNVAEANDKILKWAKYSFDAKFEDAKLKSNDGIYYDVMAGLSYNNYDVSKAADVLIKGINKVLEEK